MRKFSSESDYKKLRMCDQRAVSKLYDRCRNEFITFVRHAFSLDNGDAIELYQECFVALYENVHSGKLTEFRSSVKTYLFSIAKNKIYNRWRNAKPQVEVPEQLSECSEPWSARQEITYDVVQQMEEPCNTVLMLYYWEQLSMEEIARKMGYAGAQVAKNRKLICMRKLKVLLTSRFVAEGVL